MNHSRILLVEDDPLTVEAVSFVFEREGWRVASAIDEESVLESVESSDLDVIVLDLGLPNVSGLEVCREIRRRSAVPILVLSARASELDKVVALELGADDYVVKPHSTRELVARVRALLRRRELDAAPPTSQLTVGDLTIDLARHEVVVDGRSVQLTPSELTILVMLGKHRGAVVSRPTLVSALWSSEYVGDTRCLDAHIGRLRRKLETPGRESRITTIRGVGYKLETA